MNILYVTRHLNHSGFAVLRALIESKFNIIGVVLHDSFNPYAHRLCRPLYILVYRLKCCYYRCRPLKAVDSEELLARSAGIPIIRTSSIKSDAFYSVLQTLKPDIIVLGGGWHELIPPRVFSYPPLGCINTHPSLLPEFRGTSITRWQALHGVKRSGVTIHFVDGQFDTGGILAQEELTIDSNLTPQEMFKQLAELGAAMMCRVLARMETGTQPLTDGIRQPQDSGRHYGRWSFARDRLNVPWEKPFSEIHNFIRANAQESFQYLGPVFTVESKAYFLRETALIPVDLLGTSAWPLSHAPQDKLTVTSVASIANGYLYLSRPSDPFVLVIKLVQRFDWLYEFRRANRPCARLSYSVGDRFP